MKHTSLFWMVSEWIGKYENKYRKWNFNPEPNANIAEFSLILTLQNHMITTKQIFIDVSIKEDACRHKVAG